MIDIWYSIGIGCWYCSAVFVQYSIGNSIGVQTLVLPILDQNNIIFYQSDLMNFIRSDVQKTYCHMLSHHPGLKSKSYFAFFNFIILFLLLLDTSQTFVQQFLETIIISLFEHWIQVQFLKTKYMVNIIIPSIIYSNSGVCWSPRDDRKSTQPKLNRFLQ